MTKQFLGNPAPFIFLWTTRAAAKPGAHSFNNGHSNFWPGKMPRTRTLPGLECSQTRVSRRRYAHLLSGRSVVLQRRRHIRPLPPLVRIMALTPSLNPVIPLLDVVTQLRDPLRCDGGLRIHRNAVNVWRDKPDGERGVRRVD